jgi:hypothetical protein
VASLQQELTIEVDLKLQADAMVADFTVEVASRRAEIVRLNTEECKLHDQVDGKILLAFTVLSEFSSRLFYVADACLDSPRREAWVGSACALTPGE